MKRQLQLHTGSTQLRARKDRARKRPYLERTAVDPDEEVKSHERLHLLHGARERVHYAIPTHASNHHTTFHARTHITCTSVPGTVLVARVWAQRT
jgi:hypothetical protein